MIRAQKFTTRFLPECSTHSDYWLDVVHTFMTETPEGVVLNVRAQPRSSKAGIDGLYGDAVRVRIRCAPVDGKANKELVETLADEFGIGKSAVVFKSGETSKQKRLLLRGVTANAAMQRLNLGKML